MTVPFRDPAKLLFVDRLTQLYNWWFMAQYLRERFAWFASQKLPLSALLIDLDDFRRINETHGRLAGDVVLRRVAELLHEGRRRGGYAIRYAGDEFFVFLEGAEADRAAAIGESIRERIAAEPIVVPHAAAGIPIRASVGVATFPDEIQTASGLIEKVRRAAAHAKRRGKNQVSRDAGHRLLTDKEALAQFHRPRLLARERELELVMKIFAEAPAGRSRFILIEGEHGLGKSRLLAELPGLARSAGLKFLQGGCLAQNQAVPYSALAPLLQEYFDRSPELVAPVGARLAGPRLEAVASVLPSLAPGKGAAEGVSAPEHRWQLFHGILDLLCLISEGHPLGLFIENIHWADEATLEVFLHLLSRDDGKVLVCATAVTDSSTEPAPGVKFRALPTFLPFLQASPQFNRLPLSPLTLAQVGDLTSDILRHPIPARFQQQLFQVSRGVPLLVEETLKGLITRGALRQEEGAWNFEQVTPEDFPASGDEAIARRLENLEPETLEVVSEASIIGQEVDLLVLADVLGRDSGETLQLVDRGRHSGVFEAVDPVADAGEIRFSSARLRELVYDGVDAAHRRETHRKVAQVYERLAGPRADEAIGPIAYHFERSDDTGKSSFYRQKLEALRDWLFSAADVGEAGPGGGGTGAGQGGTEAGGGTPGAGGGGEAGTVRVRIPEASQPLQEAAWSVALGFTKALTLAVKNMRVFPEGSQLVREEVAGATTALGRLLEHLEAVTLSEHRGALVVNGQTVQGKALAALAQDLLRFFSQHGIRSVTFVRGVIESEVQETVKILSGPPPGIPPEIAAWEALLASRGILHAGIFPAIYLAATRPGAERTTEESPLGDEAMRLSAEVFRSLGGAVDNLRLYPPENELNIAIQDRLERQARALLERIPIVTLALVEESIVINGARPNPKWFGITIPLLHKLMKENGLTSVTLRRGLSRPDLQVFLTQLAQPGTDDTTASMLLGKALEERGITTIQIGSRFYAAARGSLTGGGGPGGAGAGRPGAGAGGSGAATGPGAPSAEDLLFEQVAQWLDTHSAATGFREEELPAAVGSWLDADRTDLAHLLWQRIMAGLADPLESARQRAAAALNVLLTGANLGTLSWVGGQSLEPLEKALLKETSPRAFQWEVRAATEALKLRLGQGDLAGCLGLAEALGRGQVGKPDQKKLLPIATTAVENMAATGALQPLLGALKESDPARREEAQALLAGLGEGTLKLVANIVTGEEDAEIRKIAATLLRSLPGAGLRLLGPQLHPPTPAQVSCRIIAVLDLLSPELGPDFLPLLAHPDIMVRAEFAGVISRLSRAAALRFLQRDLAEPHAEIVAGALECIRGMQGAELVEPIVRLLGKGAPPETLKACCICLGRLKDQRAVAPLIQVLERRPRFLGLVRGLPETVRAAAARALGELGFPEASRALRAAAKDRSLAVRSTARLALSRLKQEREA